MGAVERGRVFRLIVQGRGTSLMRHNRAMWQQELDAFARHLRAAGRTPATIRLRRMHLERAFTAMGKPPADVLLEDLIDYMAAHDWKPETRKSVRSSLRNFYQWADSTGLVPDDPSRKLPSVKVPQGIPHPADDDALARGLAAASDDVRLMVALAAFAGLRRAEVAGLHSSDITGGSLRITGKGGRTRLVPMHPLIMEALQARPPGYVFPGKDHGHLSPDWVGRQISRVLGDGATAHMLRHRFATRAYAGERDLLTVQRLLGHSSVATTQRYTEVPDDALRRAVMNVA